MNKIYKGQSALRLTVKIFTELEGIQAAAIKYRKPDGSTGSFTAGVADAEKGVIFHECVDGDLDAGGWWVFWAFITFDDGRTATGEAAKVYVWKEGAG
jgi:hypothetical protein